MRSVMVLLSWVMLFVTGIVYSEIQPRMYVEGNSLFDRCGKKVVIRGVNAMIVIWDPTGEVSYPEIAKTGANCVRIFWSTTSHSGNTLENFDATLTNCWENNMIPMPCVWGRWGGDWQYLQEAVDFWLRPEWVEVLRKHEDHILLNIANEVGNKTVTDSMFREGYEKAVLRLRNAGLHMPLVIDASGHGRDESVLFKSAEYLLEKDPDHNLIFSWHLYDHIAWSGKRERVEGALDTMAMMDNTCFIVGEFSQCQSGSYDDGMEGCEKQKVEWEYLIERCEQEQIGWLAWVWWCCNGDGDLHTIVKDKTYGNWANPGWGEEIAVTSPYSIKNTSQRTYFLNNLSCEMADPAPPGLQVPNGLSAVCERGAKVTLRWNDNNIAERNYDIQVRTGNEEWRLLETVAQNQTECTVNAEPHGLQYKTTYSFRVGAFERYGNTAFSQPVEISTKTDPVSCSTGKGLTVRFYHKPFEKNMTPLEEPVYERIDPTVNFEWEKASPQPGVVDSNHFIAIWSGQVEAPLTAEYEFSTFTNDFCWLFVNGEELYKLYGPNKKGWEQGKIHLEQGKKYNIKMIYREWDGIATARLYWSCPDMSKRIIPQCHLFSDTGAIVATLPHIQNKIKQQVMESGRQVRVYNLSGRCVLQTELSKATGSMDVKKLPRGVFVIRSYNKRGNVYSTNSSTRTVVVE